MYLVIRGNWTVFAETVARVDNWATFTLITRAIYSKNTPLITNIPPIPTPDSLPITPFRIGGGPRALVHLSTFNISPMTDRRFKNIG